MNTAPTCTPVRIGDRLIGPGLAPYVIAELSANHMGRLDRTLELVRIARDAGADAIKLQTYTPESMTLDSSEAPFVVGAGTLWAGRSLFDLYAEAALPWEWHEPIIREARRLGIACFSSPFDRAGVELLDDLDVPALKIASFELVDLDLIRCAAETGRPLIMSTGMATASEIDEAVDAARGGGATELILLRCNSSYPAPGSEMDLRTIPDMAHRLQVPIGLSDHTLGTTAAVAAVALGACVIEKHFTFSRAEGGPDAAFSSEPSELADLVEAVHAAADMLGTVRYGPSPAEEKSLAFRRSLFVVVDLAAGSTLSRENVRAIRPGHGLAPREFEYLLGRRVLRDTPRGTPLTWDIVEPETSTTVKSHDARTDTERR